MTRGRILRRATWILLVLLGSTACAGSRAQNPERNSSAMMNTTRFGDWQNRSHLPVQGRLGDEIVWSRASLDERHQRTPLHLGLRDGQVLVQYPTILAALDRAGVPQWQVPASTHFEFHMDDRGIGTLNANGRYTLRQFDGREGMSLLLPLMSEIVRLVYSHQKGDELRYVFSSEPTPVNAPGMESSDPAMVYHRLAYDSGDLRWMYHAEDSLLTVLRDEAGEWIYLVGGHGIHVLPSDATDPSGVRVIEATEVEIASLDANDRLLAVLRDDDGRFLRCLDAGGDTVWQVDLGEDPLGAQPPAGVDGDRVLLLAGGELRSLVAGVQEWAYAIPPTGDEVARFTVLADGGVLLAAGSNLIQLHADGTEMVRVPVDSPLTCRPVMDDQGRVYVGARAWIRCYR